MATPRTNAQRAKERDFSAQRGDAGIVAASPFGLFSQSGLVVTATGIAGYVMQHSHRIRGVSLFAKTVTTSGSITLKVGGTAVLTTEPFVAGKASYVEFGKPIDVPPGTEVTMDIASNGLTGATVALDIIP